MFRLFLAHTHTYQPDILRVVRSHAHRAGEHVQACCEQYRPYIQCVRPRRTKCPVLDVAFGLFLAFTFCSGHLLQCVAHAICVLYFCLLRHCAAVVSYLASCLQALNSLLNHNYYGTFSQTTECGYCCYFVGLFKGRNKMCKSVSGVLICARHKQTRFVCFSTFFFCCLPPTLQSRSGEVCCVVRSRCWFFFVCARYWQFLWVRTALLWCALTRYRHSPSMVEDISRCVLCCVAIIFHEAVNQMSV